MAVSAIGAGDNTKWKAISNYYCHDCMEGFSNLVFA